VQGLCKSDNSAPAQGGALQRRGQPPPPRLRAESSRGAGKMASPASACLGQAAQRAAASCLRRCFPACKTPTAGRRTQLPRQRRGRQRP
jgi:hypothetical protein